MGCSQPEKAKPPAPPPYTAVEDPVTVGGKPAVTLESHTPVDTAKAQFLSVDVLPGRGMNIYRLMAYLPGKGNINLFESPSLEEAQKLMDGGPDDQNGRQSFLAGGAILVPFANRIRGKLSRDGKTIETTILGKKVDLIANSKGKNPKAEPHAMHGLILATPFATTSNSGPQEASVTGTLDAGDFGGHWLSKTYLTIVVRLQQERVSFAVTAKNTGSEELPVGIGWHPYFRFPGGTRQVARLHIPAKTRALVNNYDDVFPTGKLVPVKGTPYDFSAPAGAPLNMLFLDDCFVDLQENDQRHAVAEIIDPTSHYGMRITTLSPAITAFQAYAPVDKSFVAFEPQFNWADPYSKIWGNHKTGMVVLKPGEQVTYSVQLELFNP
jgi:galactose mutarotase-like enzyme